MSIPFESDIDLQTNEAKNLRVHQAAAAGDFSAWVDGQLGYFSDTSDKHLVFKDTQLDAMIRVPRFDRDEAVTGQWSFSPGSAQAPFALGANAYDQKVLRFNADLLDGYHADTAATGGTVAVRDASGRMKAAVPSANDDVANKGWVVDTIYGITAVKTECRVKSTANVMLSSPGTAIFDGVTLISGERLFLNDQSNAAENGIYVFNGSSSALTRAADADTDDQVFPGITVFISEGTVWGNSRWQLTTDDPITLGATDLTFSQISGAGEISEGNGIVKVGNTLHFAQSSNYTAGALFKASGSTTVDQLALGSANQLFGMNSGGTGYEHKAFTVTAAGTVTAGVWNGTAIGVAYGGTGLSSAAAGDLLYGSASNTLSALAAGANGKWLKVVSGLPSWQNIAATDVTSGAALTKADDTNVTLTLGGSPSSALLAATSLTLGWTGTLAVARGGTGTGTSFTQGSVVFAGASGAYSQNNSTLFWNTSLAQLIVGANTGPSSRFHLSNANSHITMTSTTAATDEKIWYVDCNNGVFRIFTTNDANSAFNHAINISRSGVNVSTVSFPNGNVNIASLTASKVVFTDSAKNLTSSGTVGVTQGGTGLSACAAGDILYGSATNTLSALAVGANGKWLKVVSGLPSWQSITASDVTSGAALAKTDDSNVTLTLGGSPTTALLAATSLTLGWTGTLAVARGGTGTGTSFTQGSVVFAGASGVYSQDNSNLFYDSVNHRLSLTTLRVAGTNTVDMVAGSASTYDVLQVKAVTSNRGGSLVLSPAGTGNSSKIAFLNDASNSNADSLFISCEGAVANISPQRIGSGGAAGQVTSLNLGGGAGAGAWTTVTVSSGSFAVNSLTASKVVFTDGAKNLTSSGTVGVTQGGTGLSACAAGDILYGSATNTLSALAVGANGKWLKVVSGLPSWQSIAAADVTGGVALTKADDTNVTLTLGGSPATALLAATSLTLGWTGQLGVSRGGTGTGTAFTQGSVVFAGASGVYTQNNSLLFWDNTNGRFGIGTNTPSTQCEINGNCTISGLSERRITKKDTGTGDQWFNFNVDATAGNRARVQFFRDGGGTAADYTVVIHDGSGNYSPKIFLSATLDSYFLAGKVGFGTSVPAAQIHSIATTEQLRLSYNTSNYTSWTVSSGGNLTVAPTGGLFSITGNVGVSGLTATKVVFTDSSKNLTSSGTVGVTQGGTGLAACTTGDLFYGSAANTISSLSVGTNGKWLKVVSGLPSWQSIAAADVTSGAALTKADDTNVTLTLGGSPATALLAATSLTLGWTGQLAIARGGTGAATALGGFNALSPLTTRGDLLTRDASNNTRLAIGTIGKFLRSDGTDPGWQNITASDITSPATLTAGTGLTFSSGTGANAVLVAGTLGINQAFTPAWTGLHTYNPGSTAVTAILLDMAQPASVGQRDSHDITWRGTGYDSTGHNADWKCFVDVTSNAAASIFKIQSRVDVSSFATRFALSDSGAITTGTWNASTIGVAYGGTNNSVSPSTYAATYFDGTKYTGHANFLFDPSAGAVISNDGSYLQSLTLFTLATSGTVTQSQRTLYVFDQRTSGTAGVQRTGADIVLTGAWSGAGSSNAAVNVLLNSSSPNNYGAYLDVFGGTNNYSIYSKHGKIHIDDLSASSLLQLDSNKDITASNNLPTTTTIGSKPIARLYAVNVTGDGSATTFTITHNLGTKTIAVGVWRDSDDKMVQIETRCKASDPTNAIEITFTTAPANAVVYRVAVCG